MPNVFETPPPEIPVKAPDGSIIGVGRWVQGELEVDVEASALKRLGLYGGIKDLSIGPVGDFNQTIQLITKNQKEQDDG